MNQPHALEAAPEVLPSTAEGAPAERVAPLPAALAALVVLLFAGLFTGTVRDLMRIWDADDTYSHGYLVPFLSAYVAWEVAQRAGRGGVGSVGGGLLWMVLGGLFHLWAAVLGWPPLDFFAVTALLYGLALLVGGRAWAVRFAFPILFLAFLFPLPPQLTDWLALRLQATVTSLAAALLPLFAATVRSGNILEVAGERLEVGQACSGLRQLIAFGALALLVAHFSRRSWGFQLAIVLAALPVAVAANLLRVLLMAFLTVRFGHEAISETKILAFGVSYHTAWGLLTMVVGLGLFLAVRWWLTRAFPAPAPAEENAPTPLKLAEVLRRVGAPEQVRAFGVAAAALGLILGLQLGLRAHLAAAEATEAPGLLRPLSGFPVTLGPWSGREEAPAPNTLPYFNAADDRLNRLYKGVAGAVGADVPTPGLECRLFLVHFKDGSDRRHHPEICHQVAGFAEDLSGRDDLELLGQEGKARRFCFTRGGLRSYVYYWHYTFEPSAEEQLSNLQRIHQQVGVRRPSVTLQVFTNGTAPEHLKEVADFVRRVDEALQPYLPPGARRGCEVLPVKFVP